MEPIFWLEDPALKKLADMANDHTDIYLEGDFDDFFSDNKKYLRDYGAKIDLSMVERLSGKSIDEVSDSCMVFSAISGMHVSTATKGNAWAYLSHTYLLKYGRTRWLRSARAKKNMLGTIQKHFNSYAPQTLRDDHASSRPWWNGYIASYVAGSTQIGDIKQVLDVFAKTTETRMQSIERPSIFNDIYLVKLLQKYLILNPEVMGQDPYRDLMKQINYLSNGVDFSEMKYDYFINNFILKN